MINLQMFTTEEDLMKLTGLSRDELWDNGFDLDDWDVGFVSDVPLTTIVYDDDYDDDDEYEEPIDDDDYDDDDDDLGDYDYEEPVDDAYWLVRQMENYCIGYAHIEFKGRHYYMVHHA